MNGIKQDKQESVDNALILELEKPSHSKRLEYVRNLVIDNPKLVAQTVKFWIQNHGN